MTSQNVESLLSRVTAADVVQEPYPHIVVRNALSPQYYQTLAAGYPSVAQLRHVIKVAQSNPSQKKRLQRTLRHLKRPNKRVNIPSELSIASPDIESVWRDFIAFHRSNEFFQEMVHIFHDAIHSMYPALNLDDVVSVPREEFSALQAGAGVGNLNFASEAMLALNTPTWWKSSITGPHTDHPRKLFIGLFYLRHPDDCGGGHLQLHRRLGDVTEANLKWPDKHTVELCHEVAYEENTFVLLLNSASSVHSVTARHRSRYPRRFMNVIAEGSSPLF